MTKAKNKNEAEEQGQNLNNSIQTNELELKIEELKSQKIQLMADFENYRKRVENERATFGAIANMGLISEMLEIFDDIQMALNDEALNLEHAKTSLKSAQDKITGSVKHAGIEKVEVKVGDEFDKSKMEAIQTIPDESNKNKVVAVISSAYKYVGQENILKPAKVIVGK